MSKSVITLITGGNTGLGLEIVKSLYQSTRSYTILLGGRSVDKATAAAKEVRESLQHSGSTITPVQIDIEDDTSIEELVDLVTKEYGRIDVLVNNAGTQLDQQLQAGKMTMRDMWNKTWAVNVTSTQVFTFAMAPLLLKSDDPRMLFITSGTSTLGEHQNQKLKVNAAPSKGWPKESLSLPAYRAAKTGLNMAMLEWARLLREDGVKVWGVSPGMLATGLGGNPEFLKSIGAIDPAIGAGVVRGVIEGARDEDAGKVVRKDEVQPW